MLKKSPPPASAIGVEDQTPMPASPTSIQIAYAKPDDTLQSLVVSQFTGANVLRTVSQGDGEASVLRFDGGVPIWKFHANRTLLNPLTKIKQAPYLPLGVLDHALVLHAMHFARQHRVKVLHQFDVVTVVAAEVCEVE